MENEMLNEQLIKLQEENAKLLEALKEKNQDCETAKAFFAEFPFAEDFVDDICQVVEQVGAKDKSDLVYAYAKVLSEKYKNPKALVDDEDFLANNVYTNEKIREFFIKEFLEKVKKAPVGCLKRGSIPSTTADKPKTIASAGEMARALFRK